jgi:hypothetical protein
MICCVHCQHARKSIGLIQLLLGLIDEIGIAGQRTACWGIASGDLEVWAELVAKCRCRIQTHADSHHLATLPVRSLR